MPGNKTQGFLCTWKIEKFNSIPDYKELKSPSFQIKKFCHSEWKLVLDPKKSVKSSERGKFKHFVSCYLELSRSSNIVEEIPVSFRFHLLCPKGNVFKTSKLFTEKKSLFKYPTSYYELIAVDTLKQEMSNWPEDTLTLCCLMESVLDYDSLSPTTSKTAITGCKLETNVCEYDSSFIWSLKESKSFKKYPLNIKEIKLGDITVKVIIKQRSGIYKFYLFSDINDERHHTLSWCAYLMKEKQIEKMISFGLRYFGDQQNVYDTGAEIDMNILQIDIEVKFDISCLASSLVNYCYADEKYDIETQSMSLELFKSGRTSEEESVYCLQQNFSKLLVDKEFTDVQFRVDNEMMTGHKNILACRSPVFAAMFDQQMTENNTGIVDIVDVEAKTFSSFLEYIYTGSVEKMDEELALNLLVVADKYDVPSLAKKCSLLLMSVLSNRNLCKVLLIADMVHQKELKSFVVEFILKNSTSILSSPEWLQIVLKNNALATELLLLISKKLDEKSKMSEVSSEEASWDCSSCLSENNGDKDKCASCSAAQIDKINKNNIDLSLKKTLWVCSSCPALNVGDEAKCTICDGVQESKRSASTAQPSITTFENNLSSTPAMPFQFGSQPTIATSTPTIGFGGAASSAFAFGNKPETVNSLQPAASSTQMPVPAFGSAPTQLMFGNSTTPAFGKQTPGGFNFGLPTSSNSTPVFQFGVEKKQATPQSGFSLGTPSQDTMNQNFQPQFNISTPPSFNFGATSSAGPFQFVPSSDSSQAASAGPRKIRKACRRMK
ncbi:uncharacterized protein [Parasteatoda tepidariorum]|uniref:uncharacterized protein isoform X2 n=1 Tax=Parasteatoda tepidariorum TaxID=114398 RepID=UPI001C725B82|nr:uncharacterized protein LOC107449786 isoform X2 [Parasteatoda tepidariorum]